MRVVVSLVITFVVLFISPQIVFSQSTADGAVNISADIPTPIPSIVTFSGRAYPGSTVNLLRDGQLVLAVPAGADANFQFSLGGISKGTYVFALYTTDSEGRQSSTESYTVFVGRNVTVLISGIFLGPTTDVDKSIVRQGENLAIFGQTTPNADVTIEVSEGVFVNAVADENGVYLYNFDTSVLALGDHAAKSRASVLGETSQFGLPVSYEVATVTIPKSFTCRIADLNCDGRVNLVDFSIAAFWYLQPLSTDFQLIETERLNGDGIVNLVDFSIMAFYWTG